MQKSRPRSRPLSRLKRLFRFDVRRHVGVPGYCGERLAFFLEPSFKGDEAQETPASTTLSAS